MSKLHLFIAALSGRALAQAVQGLSLPCTVADCFGDADTRRYSLLFTNISHDDDALRMDEQKLLQALSDCAAYCKHSDEQLCVITGTGFESQLEMLRSLQKHAQSLGAVCAFNDADVMSDITNPEMFFSALDGLGVAHPATRFTPPNDDKGWWVKQCGGHGASHIRPFLGTAEIALEHIYYQEDIQGSQQSMLANSYISNIVCISFNQQQILRSPQDRFQYCGAIAVEPAEAEHALGISTQLQTQLSTLAQALCKRFKLRGLLSLDFILSDDRAYVLEINARPTATFELLDSAAALVMHLQAFGVWKDAASNRQHQHSYAGHRYVFAPHDLRVTSMLERGLVQHKVMSHITDWPMLNTYVPAGAPLCNLHAQGQSLQAVQTELDALEHKLIQSLFNQEAQPLRLAA